MTAAEKGRCAVIATALDAGDQRPWLRAEPSLSVAQKALIWDLRAHVVAAGGRGKKNLRMNSCEGLPKRDIGMTSATVADLDFWSDEPDAPGDDPGDELDLKTKVCDNCRGLGLTSDGVRCQKCNGSGRVPRDDVDDGEEDDDEFEDEE
jgi:hypothetical protein